MQNLISLFTTIFVTENKAPNKTFGPKREEMVTSWREVHNEELIHLHFFLNIIRTMTSVVMRWEGNVAQME
jgi:hypothetical protein